MRTRLVPIQEVRARLAALDVAQPVVRPSRAIGHFLRLLRSMKLPRPPVVKWLDGPSKYQSHLRDQDIYLGSDDLYHCAFYSWRDAIRFSMVVDNHAPVWVSQLPHIQLVTVSFWPELFRDENYLKAIENGLGTFAVTKKALILFPRPGMRFREERGRGQVLHSTLGPAIHYPKHPQSNQFWFRGVRVPEFVITHPEKITLAHIRAARSLEQRNAMIDQFGLIKYAEARKFRPVDVDTANGVTLWVTGGKRGRFSGEVTERRCVLEMINATPEPDGTHRRFGRRVPGTVQTAREAVAWTFGLRPEQYNPDVQT